YIIRKKYDKHPSYVISTVMSQYTIRQALVVHLLSSVFFTPTATTEIYTLSLHDALPISASGFPQASQPPYLSVSCSDRHNDAARSEEHTSELQSRFDLVCRLLLEKKKLKLFSTYS